MKKSANLAREALKISVRRDSWLYFVPLTKRAVSFFLTSARARWEGCACLSESVVPMRWTVAKFGALVSSQVFLIFTSLKAEKCNEQKLSHFKPLMQNRLLLANARTLCCRLTVCLKHSPRKPFQFEVVEVKPVAELQCTDQLGKEGNQFVFNENSSEKWRSW